MNLYLRPSCYHCSARQGKSGADISIADYWGVQSIHPEMDDDKGMGLIMVNTQLGVSYYNAVKNHILYLKSSYEKAILHNPNIVNNVKIPDQRGLFWNSYYTSKIDSIKTICDKMTPSPIVIFTKRLIRKIRLIIKL